MEGTINLETERLILRQWVASDYPVFAEINSDPEAMKYFPATLNRQQSDELAEKIRSLIAKKGWGFWAVELKKDRKFLGFTGLHKPDYELPFAPCVEIGWRFAKRYWGHGYATEAAVCALNFAFENLQLPKVVAFTASSNMRSQAVMKRLHMINSGKNFEHPMVPCGSALREHVLYEMTVDQWKQEYKKL